MAGKVGKGKGSKPLKRTSSDLDDLLNDPFSKSSSSSSTPSLSSSKVPPKKVRPPEDDHFLEENSLDCLLKQKNGTNTSTNTNTTNTPKKSTPLRRSRSSDDEFLDMEPFSTNKYNNSQKHKEKAPRHDEHFNDHNEDDDITKRKRLKSKLAKELQHIIPHLSGILKGTIPSERAEKYNKGGKDRKGMKWTLSTGGFSELEFDLIIELLKQHFPQCDLHYITDVLWQEAAVQLLMERKELKSHQKAESILKAVELSSVDRQELRRYQSDSSLLDAVAKYQEMIDSPVTTPNSSQEKKPKSKSPSSSQEKPASQERKPRSMSASSSFTSSINRAQTPTSSNIPDAPAVDLTKISFKKQHIVTNTTITTTTTIASSDDDFDASSSTPSSSSTKPSSKFSLASPTKASPKKVDNEGTTNANQWIPRKVKT